MDCLLCYNDSNEIHSDVYECTHCHLVFKNPEVFLDKEAEEARYSNHENTIEDQGYVDFLNRLLLPLKTFIRAPFQGLDYGCGPGPTLSVLLEKEGGEMENYDPIFFPDAHLLLPDFYNVVTSTEVVEHFKHPHYDWKKLIELVSEGGYLGIMTQFYSSKIDYLNWWYKNDPTHVVFYQQETLHYIAKEHDLEIVYNDEKSVVIFKKLQI